MNKKFTDIFIKRPVLATVVSLLILFVGIRSLTSMQVRLWPVVYNTVISITTAYPGANPEVIQGFVTNPMEKQVASADGIDYITSSSDQNVSTVNAYIKLGYDPEKAFTDISAKVSQAEQYISQNAQKPIILKQTGSQMPAMWLTASSTSMTPIQIGDYLRRKVVPIINTIEGVADDTPIGYQTAMRIWLNPTAMTAYNITPASLISVLKQNNLQAAGGIAKGKYLKVNINPKTDLHTVEAFKKLVIKSNGPQVIRLENIAKIELGSQNTDSSSFANGKESVFMPLSLSPSANPLTVANTFYKLLPSLKQKFPPGFHLDIIYDSTTYIRASIKEVIETILITTAIVILVILLFLGALRNVVIPAVTIPLSLIGVGTLMLAFGFSINQLTLLAMVLAIGMVVDDAIVVMENVYRHIEEGASPMQAALVGTREIASPVITMSLTLVAVYAPIGLMGGITGSLFTEFAFTLAGAIVISAIIALTLSPMLCSKILSKSILETPLVKKVDSIFLKLKNAYRTRLTSALKYRPATFFMAIIILLSCFVFFKLTPSELAPKEDQGFIFLQSIAPQYANVNYIERFTKLLYPISKKFPQTAGEFSINGYPQGNQSVGGIALIPWDQRKISAEDLIHKLQPELNTQLAGIQTFAAQPPALPVSGGIFPFQFEIKSIGDYETLYKFAEKLNLIAQKSHMFLATVNRLKINRPQADVLINRNKAASLGITMQDISASLSASYAGAYSNYFSMDGYSYEVIPQLARMYRQNPGQLNNIYVKSITGQLIPLASLVTIKQTIEPNSLSQFQQMNNAEIDGLLFPGVTQGDAVAFMQQQANKILPPSMSYDYSGTTRQFVQQGNSFIYTFVFALIIIYLLLAAQFESFRDPFIILFSVPLSICGALIPLFLGLATINIYTEIGLVTLIGLICKHGILIVEFANKLRDEQGMGIHEAIIEAASVRLRPVLMTTASMVFGVVPLLVATGAGAHSRFDIGLVIASGMTIGTIFTLFVVPTVYTYFTRKQRTIIATDS